MRFKQSYGKILTKQILFSCFLDILLVAFFSLFFSEKYEPRMEFFLTWIAILWIAPCVFAIKNLLYYIPIYKLIIKNNMEYELYMAFKKQNLPLCNCNEFYDIYQYLEAVINGDYREEQKNSATYTLGYITGYENSTYGITKIFFRNSVENAICKYLTELENKQSIPAS